MLVVSVPGVSSSVMRASVVRFYMERSDRGLGLRGGLRHEHRLHALPDARDSTLRLLDR